MAVSQAQVDAVVAHLSAEFDAASADVRQRDFGWWNSDLKATLLHDLAQAKSDELRTLSALAVNHPEMFAAAAVQAEKDLRGLSGYAQAATVQQVLRDTAAATEAQVVEGVQAVGEVATHGLAAVLSALPWWLYAGAALAVLGVGAFYLGPFLRRRA